MRRGSGAGAGDADSDMATGGSAVTYDVRPASNQAAQGLHARNLAGGARSRMGSTSSHPACLTYMAALAAVRLVLARSTEGGAHTPASFSQTGHVTAAQLEERRTNPAAATFAFLLDSGAVVGHLMTADAARFDPTTPAAMSSDPAELPPNMREYHAWLLSNVGDPATVHDAQEAHQRAMRQPTVSGPDTTWLPACASCESCTPSRQVAERRLTTRRVSACSLREAVQFAASPPLRELVAPSPAVSKSRYFLHPELVTVRLPHPAGDAGAGAAPDAASAGLAPPPARASFHSPTARTTTPHLTLAGATSLSKRVRLLHPHSHRPLVPCRSSTHVPSRFHHEHWHSVPQLHAHSADTHTTSLHSSPMCTGVTSSNVCLRLPPHRPTRSQDLMCCRIALVYMGWDNTKKEGIFWGDRVITPEQGEEPDKDRGEMTHIACPRLWDMAVSCLPFPRLDRGQDPRGHPLGGGGARPGGGSGRGTRGCSRGCSRGSRRRWRRCIASPQRYVRETPAQAARRSRGCRDGWLPWHGGRRAWTCNAATHPSLRSRPSPLLLTRASVAQSPPPSQLPSRARDTANTIANSRFQRRLRGFCPVQSSPWCPCSLRTARLWR
jgi:hypothetical protein